jgi:hypothetical protein
LVSCGIEKLIEVNIENNNFEKQDLTLFSNFVKLEKLYLGTTKQDKIQKDTYNRFTGSLETLKNLTKLKELDISNTDINAGLEYLPNNLKKIYCINYFSNKVGCEEIQKELESCLKYLKNDVKYYDFQE